MEQCNESIVNPTNDGNTFDKQSVKLLSKIEKTFVLYTLFGIKLCIFLAFCSIKRKIMFFCDAILQT